MLIFRASVAIRLILATGVIAAVVNGGPLALDKDVLSEALSQEGVGKGPARRLMMAAEAESVTLPSQSATDKLDELNAYFFGPSGFTPIPDASSPQGASVTAALEQRRGTCVTLAVIYLSMARRLGLDAHAVATPVHMFVRVRLPDRVRNVELMEGGIELDDDIYRRRYRITQEAIDAGVFMRDLTDDELIAHLLSNQGVALSKQGKPREALRRYDKALKLHPILVAAWYNRGIDLLNLGKLKKALASFDRAIGIYAADAQAHNNRGLVRARLGDRAGAEADFRLALQIQPDLAAAEANLRRLKDAEAARVVK